LVVVTLAPDAEVRIFVNPRVTWAAVETAVYPEGSLSMPGVREEIMRPARVRVAFQDLDGKEREEEADGLLAICLQHEIDQLDGIFWIDRLSRLKRERLVRRYLKLQRAEKP
jgi:peptide deformylase